MYALLSRVFLLLFAPVSAFALDLFAGLLVWQASEEPALLWASSVSFAGDVEFFTGENLTFDWDLGFRVGGGHAFECDCWEMQVYWTSFRNCGSKSLPKVGELIETQLFGGFLNKDLSESASIALTLQYNLFDVNVGKNFCLPHCLSLTPFIGLKGGWIDQSIHTSWQNVTFEPIGEYTATEDLKNDFWGVGPAVGVISRWGLNTYVSLFGDFEAAFLYGTWKSEDVYQSSQPKIININMDNSQLGSLTLRAFVGLGWEWGHFTARIGYETQIWFDQFRMPTFQQLPVHGDLTLHGGTLTGTFAF